MRHILLKKQIHQYYKDPAHIIFIYLLDLSRSKRKTATSSTKQTHRYQPVSDTHIIYFVYNTIYCTYKIPC